MRAGRNLLPALAAVLVLAAPADRPADAAGPAREAPSRARLILERYDNANGWRNHVMVIAHRAGWKEGGHVVRAENSLAAIDHAVAIGAEMVELDVRRTADGALIVMHDSWLDRTTDCRGEVAKMTLAEIAPCHLVVEGSGAVTAETVPTFRDMLLAAKDRILIDIDNKLEIADLVDIAAEARAVGMADQIVLKQNLWNDRKIAEMKAAMDKIGPGVRFIPILADDAVHDAGFVARATATFKAPATEMIVWHRDGEAKTETGGSLFSDAARSEAVRGNWHMGIDTIGIVNRADGMLSGGRGDAGAIEDGAPGETWGFWVDRGVTLLMTDEPDAAIGWLAAQGHRMPYDLTN